MAGRGSGFPSAPVVNPPSSYGPGLDGGAPKATPEPPHIVRTFTATAVGAAGNVLAKPSPLGPSGNRMWHIRAVRIVAGNPIAQAGDTVDLHIFTGPLVPSTGTEADQNPSQWRDTTNVNAVTPEAGYWGGEELVVKPGEFLYFVLTGTTVGRLYTITGVARDIPITARHHAA